MKVVSHFFRFSTRSFSANEAGNIVNKLSNQCRYFNLYFDFNQFLCLSTSKVFLVGYWSDWIHQLIFPVLASWGIFGIAGIVYYAFFREGYF